MTVDDYVERVIRHFKSGKATKKAWDALAAVVLDASRFSYGRDLGDIHPHEGSTSLDIEIFGPKKWCSTCGKQEVLSGFQCESCGGSTA